jgi:hypothetical protein
MSIVAKILGIWFALNLAIPAFIIYQRSPHLRHRLFWRTLGVLAMPHERQLSVGQGLTSPALTLQTMHGTGYGPSHEYGEPLIKAMHGVAFGNLLRLC